ncbi:hypothetical protein [Streptantibioticus ferralitis]|uniref:Uncharacterized protein n=1 Tax=Streptantibioticus ferralitis TaxID=236510 RepID=A0ABT5Z9N3_9ACTN|nr:hypothetical protein [Streptantibioticus ferralitis]MDF2260541.1 hypothetical protein [Streptantibioticus ferralitis]
MQQKPIDTGRLGQFMCVIAPERRVDPTTDEPRKDREGREQWIVGLSVRQAAGRRTDVIHVVVPGQPRGIAEGMSVRVVDLWANDWSVDGRSGTSWRAEQIVPAGGTAASGGSAAAAPAARKGGE